MNHAYRLLITVTSLALCSAAWAQQAVDGPLILEAHTLTPDQLIETRVHDAGFYKGDANYNSIGCASDGKVYYTISVHQKDEYGQMYVFDPATQEVKHLADFGDMVGEKNLKTMPQGKSHVGIFEHKGKLYTAIMQGFYHTADEIATMPDLRGYSPFPGGHFIEYDLATGRITDLARAPQDEGPITMAIDKDRDRLYGLTFPGGRFVYYGLGCGRFKDVAKVFRDGERKCRTLAVDPRDGDVYWSNINGDIMVFRYATENVETLETCSLRSPAFDRVDGWRSIVWYPREKAFYGLHKSNNHLFKFDPEAQTVEPLRELGVAACQAAKGSHSGDCDVSTLAFALGPDGDTLYYLATGAGIETADGHRQTRTVNFITYHIPTRKYTDHGKLCLVDGRFVLFAQSIAIGGGKIYAVAWEEVPQSDAKRLKKVKAAKSAVLLPDEPISQMNLISFTDPLAK